MGIKQISKAHSYGEKMKIGLKISNLEQQLNQTRQLISSLAESEGSYAAHTTTGIVYDVTILANRIRSIEEEIAYLTKEVSWV